MRSSMHTDGINAVYASTYMRNKESLFSEYKLCSFSNALLTYSQLESCRKVVTRIIKRQKPKGMFLQSGVVSMPFTQKAKNARMGRGKGGIQGYVLCTKIYSALFVLRNVSSACASRAAAQIQKKLSIDVCLVNIKLPVKLKPVAGLVSIIKRNCPLVTRILL
jgi:large subunit ribosomal protein L16